MRPRAGRIGIALCAGWLAAAGVQAVEPVTIHHGRLADFLAGEGSGVSLDSDGRLSRAPALARLVDVGAERIWALAGSHDGQLYVASGDDGRLFILDDDVPRELARIDAGALLSLAVGIHNVYTGSGPGGLLLRTGADGRTDTLLSTPSRYVWDLAIDEEGILLACGAEARVLRWRRNGEVDTLFHEPADGHVRTLARRGSRWLAGTAAVPADDVGHGAYGRIYELDGHRGARLLVETAFEEVADLAPMGEAVIAAVMTVPASGDPTAALLRISDDGTVVPVWEGSGIWAGVVTTEEALVAVTREPTRVLRLHGDGDSFQILARSDSLSPSAVTQIGDELILGDSQSGRLVLLSPSLSDSGYFDAPVQDLGTTATWGTLSWNATGEGVYLRTRSGNSGETDDSWSPWSERLQSPGVTIPSPPARYLQYRVVLTGDAGVSLDRVSFTARQANLPPRIEEVITFPYRGGASALQNPEQIPLPGQGRSDASGVPQRKSLRVLRWRASDPNGDPLSFRIYLRSDDQREWKLVEDDVRRVKTVLWDTELMPEGVTRLKLVATDAPANPGKQALEDTYVTEPFVIDNTPPALTLRQRRQEGGIVIEAHVEDAVSILHGARYSIDYADRTTRLAAADGLFDGRREQVRVVLTDLEAGEHVISVQAWDEMDNIGVAQIVVDIAP